ncbi:hypothetical protein E5D57_003180 [Metarhizium anisopliae]|nr:hypothetical protein E5D57_013630 [Metarhizium anisopliae]KAF5122387.1 hypothetical protein E5D57_012865 [Metarhizium anisopliae]KAF5122389.1 hypothetical protein E5D57_012867 [Metarhizium anisopliae]KAF5122402.1 hypothetical protein E5D57_012881 [Metarhizium anisopliae]KAF5122404.1 hypothetical protein E5D57_012883 [Metarhizium anisopliae]
MALRTRPMGEEYYVTNQGYLKQLAGGMGRQRQTRMGPDGITGHVMGSDGISLIQLNGSEGINLIQHGGSDGIYLIQDYNREIDEYLRRRYSHSQIV